MAQQMVKGNVAYKREQEGQPWMIDRQRVWFYPNLPDRRYGEGVLPEKRDRVYTILTLDCTGKFSPALDMEVRMYPYNFECWMEIHAVIRGVNL